MKVETFTEITGADFYTGVPDSRLKPLCDYLMSRYGIDPYHHIIAANEGNCAALAAGYHLATGKTAAVYLQNSGEGNLMNPVVSLLNQRVYAIPVLFIIGWRGEPGIKDEPQHLFQGEITVKFLEAMDIKAFVIRPDTADQEVRDKMTEFQNGFALGRSAAFIICKDAFSDTGKLRYQNGNSILREEVIRCIVRVSGTDPVISTTGKASRELFELRTANRQSHKYDFLTVGSMGHSSSIALGVAINKPDTRVWCIDGDGAVLMHMGALAVIGANAPSNLIHVVINNGSHETVGGMPTVAGTMDITALARACGYPYAVCVHTIEDLEQELEAAKGRNKLSLIEARCAVGARSDLGRPTTAALENKRNFMEYLMTI